LSLYPPASPSGCPNNLIAGTLGKHSRLAIE
jgi:hypothetical protein